MSSKGSSDSFSALAGTLGRLSARAFNEGDPTRKLLFSQVNEALKTGGVGAQIPMIQTAVTNSLTSSSGAMQSAKSALGQANLGSDPLSQGILSQINTQASQQRSQIPTDFASQLAYGIGPQMSTATLGPALSGMGTAAGINRSSSSSSFDPAQWAQLFSQFMSGGSSSGFAGAKSIFT